MVVDGHASRYVSLMVVEFRLGSSSVVIGR